MEVIVSYDGACQRVRRNESKLSYPQLLDSVSSGILEARPLAKEEESQME